MRFSFFKPLGIAVVSLIVIFIALFSQTAAAQPVDIVLNQTYSITVGKQTFTIPCGQSHPPDQTWPGVDHAIIGVHGASRDADARYRGLVNAAELAGAEDGTVIFAPQFLYEEDVNAHGLANDYLFWDWGWVRGDPSLSTAANPRTGAISSYAVLDDIFQTLLNPAYYPDLKTIVVVGHSAGGQMINRYAAGNQMPQTAAVRAGGLKTRYIVANPTTYMYFDQRRAVAGTTDQFEIPPATDCSWYNNYYFGLENLNAYLAVVGAAAITAQYSQRNVVYLLGADDNVPNDSDSCVAMLQGDHRLERGQIYYNYLGLVFGQAIYDLQSIEIVPGVGHNGWDLFESSAGLEALFDFTGDDSGDDASDGSGSGGGCFINAVAWK